ncbi:hypothetical protein [Alteromonas macleodii]|uniref:IrrE N-terminal-like domain-containing protein n=1 Tax=Alteromonas macleodii TaxID=28108 RepID=A0AB36FKV7_ALTMA|nr:hypothetical protein [Alteromonas macleodii]OES24169.1 hypothetical protein BFV93_4769 [Alteromonas macleodii]OES24803.1 hypothetical protein BFV95_4562 [Alteromonas macleodii]OES25081.1 hypothetical protein BFV94_4552 [Alteromonas macleodii]OES39124.1 hypothetical protein BFV96_4272 [Alteromonas macleodii]
MVDEATITTNWHVPLSDGNRILGECFDELKAFGLTQDDIPLIVKMVENPNYDYLPFVNIFSGRTDLDQHDYIHLVLGRGLMIKDEAFVLGFTAGSTNKVRTTEESLYAFFAKHVFPKEYQFSDDDVHVYRDAVKLGFISDCEPLDKVDFVAMRHLTIDEVRKAIGLEADLLEAYYRIEKRRYPDAKECQRNARERG